MSSLGYVCPVETPEGDQCGIAKNLASTCYISIERDENLIWDTISEGKYITDTPSDSNQTLFLLNGMLRGWCAGGELRTFCLDQRRTGKFYKIRALFR